MKGFIFINEQETELDITLKRIEPGFGMPAKGEILISEPFLNDIHFRRTVVLLGEHNDEGSVGFILNKMLGATTDEAVPGLLNHNFPLFYGGPVEPDTLHFIHKVGALIPGAQHIKSNIYWGGDIEIINDLLDRKIVLPSEFRFFVGYSGWSPGQLSAELKEKTWWLTSVADDTLFDNDLDHMWANVVKSLGENYSYMANSPEDPQWN